MLIPTYIFLRWMMSSLSSKCQFCTEVPVLCDKLIIFVTPCTSYSSCIVIVTVNFTVAEVISEHKLYEHKLVVFNLFMKCWSCVNV